MRLLFYYKGVCEVGGPAGSDVTMCKTFSPYMWFRYFEDIQWQNGRGGGRGDRPLVLRGPHFVLLPPPGLQQS